MCVCVLDLRQTEWHKLKVMGWRNINNVNINQKSKCCSNMDKYILKSVGENHGHFIMKKMVIFWEYIAILSVHVPNNRASKFTKTPHKLSWETSLLYKIKSLRNTDAENLQQHFGVSSVYIDLSQWDRCILDKWLIQYL